MIITTQSQLDALASNTPGYIYLEGGTDANPLIVNRAFPSAVVEVCGRAVVSVSGSATIQYVYGSAMIQRVSDSATIQYVYGSATIQSVSGSATIQRVSGSATIQRVSGSATIQSVSDSATIQSVYGSATIQRVSDSATIQYVYGSATIQRVSDSATIQYVYGSATIQSVSGSAMIQRVSDSATIQYVYGSATIQRVSGSATIQSVSDSATIQSVSDSATIQKAAGEAVISAYSAKRIVCRGYNTIIVHKADLKKIGLKLGKHARLVVLPDNTLPKKPTFAEFAARYGVDHDRRYATLYKAVHKTPQGVYHANHTPLFEYTIGKTAINPCDPGIEQSCESGLHVSTLEWARSFGSGWPDLAILECRVPIRKIVVAKDCDGKVRTSELLVVREVPKGE